MYKNVITQHLNAPAFKANHPVGPAVGNDSTQRKTSRVTAVGNPPE